VRVGEYLSEVMSVCVMNIKPPRSAGVEDLIFRYFLISCKITNLKMY
jgi:hypothetical protein